jgi:phosphatidylserine/phosphatidylglycerophosphate/cardiolipin synthase-like enzyme
MDVIIGKQFPVKVIPLIEKASHSIKIVVFDWRWYPNDPANPVSLFNQAIIRAARRGVKVEVVANSDTIIATLKSVGVLAKKPNIQNLVHAKLLIFDDKDVVIGSHNFSQSAFTMNMEVSVFIPDFSGVPDLLTFFNSLWQL